MQGKYEYIIHGSCNDPLFLGLSHICMILEASVISLHLHQGWKHIQHLPYLEDRIERACFTGGKHSQPSATASWHLLKHQFKVKKHDLVNGKQGKKSINWWFSATAHEQNIEN